MRRSTVTILGLGSIGQAIATRLNPTGVRTIGVRYTLEKGGPTDEVIGLEGAALHTALSRTDHHSLACPLTDVTRSLIGSDELRMHLPEAVNVARGEVIDTEALVATLRPLGFAVRPWTLPISNRCRPNIPLWKLENVLTMPHNAGHTPMYWARLAEIIADNVED